MYNLYFLVDTKARTLSNEVVNDLDGLSLHKITYPRPFVPQDIIRGNFSLEPTPTTGVALIVVKASLSIFLSNTPD